MDTVVKTCWRRRQLVLVGALLAAMTSCAGGSSTTAPTATRVVNASYPSYSDLAQVRRQASVVAEGRFVGERRAAKDDGGAASGPVVPVTIWNFQTTGRWPSTAPALLKVVVTDDDQMPRLDSATTYVMFFQQVDEGQRGGLRGEGTLFTPISTGEAIFVVSDRTAAALKPRITGADGSPTPSSDPGSPLVVPVQDLVRGPLG